MEWHSDHWLDLTQVHIDHTIVVGHCSRIQFLIFFYSSMNIVEFLNLLIRLPDRRQTGCLCSHNINSNTEVSTQLLNSRTYELHNFVIHISICKCCTNDCQCDILRSNALHRFSIQIDSYDLWHLNIISLIQQLFYQLRSTFAHCHRTKCTITRMTVRSQNHLTAASQHLSCELMDNCLMRWYIDSTVFLCTSKPKHMIIFIDRSTHCAERIMAVRQDIRNREFFQAGCSCRLNDSNKCNIMRG